jgi:hypothetical protein
MATKISLFSGMGSLETIKFYNSEEGKKIGIEVEQEPQGTYQVHVTPSNEPTNIGQMQVHILGGTSSCLCFGTMSTIEVSLLVSAVQKEEANRAATSSSGLIEASPADSSIASQSCTRVYASNPASPSGQMPTPH